MVQENYGYGEIDDADCFQDDGVDFMTMMVMAIIKFMRVLPIQ